MKKIILITFCSILLGSVSQQELILDLKKSLMAPCCWSGTVNDHGHGQLEEEIQSMVESGKTKDQVLDHYVQIYGERILAIPVAQGFNIMAWLAPIIIAIVGLTFITLYIKSSKSKNLEMESTGTKDESIPYDKQIEKELNELD